MSNARDLFLECSLPGLIGPGNEIAYGKLRQAADLWRGSGQHFSAGVAMLRAVDAAWGRPDQMLDAQRSALLDFDRVLFENAPETPVSLAALHKLRQSLIRASWLFDVDRTKVRTRIRELGSEIAQRLLSYFGHSDHADNYLVTGFIVTTDLDGLWAVNFPAFEVPLETE